MAEITLGGNPINTSGNLPEIGTNAPEFELTNTDLENVISHDFRGKRVILNIFVSLDTGICAASVRKFNSETEKLDNTVVLCISRDLPFAHKRFCAAEGLENVISLSEMRDFEFGELFGVRIIDGPLAGLLARSIVILDEVGKVIYTELVPEIKQEPDYEQVLAALK